METEVLDTYKEHELHNTYESECSTCFAENLIIKSGKKQCIGCDETENLEKCDGTMCRKCWEAETEEPNL